MGAWAFEAGETFASLWCTNLATLRLATAYITTSRRCIFEAAWN